MKGSIIHHPSKESINDETEVRYGLCSLAQILGIDIDDNTLFTDII